MATQNVSFLWADGRPGELIDLLRWASSRLLLLAFGDLPPAAARRLQMLGMQTGIVCVQVVAPGQKAGALEHVTDSGGQLRTTCRIGGQAGWALLRPDSYVAATGQKVDGSLVHAITTALGLQEEIT